MRLAMGSATLILVASPVLPAPLSDPLESGECSGGAFVFFRPGSALLDQAAKHMLDGFLDSARAPPRPSSVRIASGGDGTAEHWVQAPMGRQPEPPSDLDRRGWVARLISKDLAAKLYKPGMPFPECF